MLPSKENIIIVTMMLFIAVENINGANEEAVTKCINFIRIYFNGKTTALDCFNEAYDNLKEKEMRNPWARNYYTHLEMKLGYYVNDIKKPKVFCKETADETLCLKQLKEFGWPKKGRSAIFDHAFDNLTKKCFENHEDSYAKLYYEHLKGKATIGNETLEPNIWCAEWAVIMNADDEFSEDDELRNGLDDNMHLENYEIANPNLNPSSTSSEDDTNSDDTIYGSGPDYI